MGITTFSGPIKAGNIFHTTGTTVGTDMKNVGFTVMAQSEAITEAAASASTSIVIPANSQIIDIKCLAIQAEILKQFQQPLPQAPEPTGVMSGHPMSTFPLTLLRAALALVF